MKLFAILTIISFCIGFYSSFHMNFAPKQPVNDENVILREILNNFLKTYFRDDNIFVSLIILPSKWEKNRDFFFGMFSKQASTEFSYNNLNKLDSLTRDNRNPLNIIVVDDSEQLR